MLPRLLATLLLLILPAMAAEPPKLVVAIVVDQLRTDYLDRFRDQFVEGGFRRLTEGGAFLTAAHYDYAPTTTAPGHASIFTGSTPMAHGIIGNDWFDRRSRKSVYCVGDISVTGVGTLAKAGQRSPRNLIGTTVADQMRLHYGSKVIGISIKDRGAILPAGKRPAGAFWFEPATGNFITSSYYMAALPAWLATFNAEGRAAALLAKKWERLLDEKAYAWPDDVPGEGVLLPNEKKPVFPHAIPKGTREIYEHLPATPFSNELLADLAQAVIEGEHLGSGPGPDLLTVSFSAIDAVGHRYGPYSQELQDALLRLDRRLAQFFDFLEKRFGLDRVTLVLTSDHGVAPTPDFAIAQGFGGERVDELKLVGELQARLSERFGHANLLLERTFFDGQVFFDHDALATAQLSAAQVFGVLRDWAFETGKFHACYSRDQLLEGRFHGSVGQRIANAYHAERGGDAVLVYKPFVLETGSAKTGTTHGSPFAYDTHVPVLFRGAAFRTGRDAGDFAITEFAATLCAALRINPPATSAGRVCTRILVEGN